MGYIQIHNNDPDTAIYLANIEMAKWAEQTEQTIETEIAKLQQQAE